MNQQIMFGVVLWSDAAARKAVIWCEDQGELAYYTPAEESLHDGPVLDAGDLIQFDLSIQQNIRKASNPQLVVQSHSPNLPEKLRAGQGKAASRSKPAIARKSANIVVLSQYFDAPEQCKLVCSG